MITIGSFSSTGCHDRVFTVVPVVGVVPSSRSAHNLRSGQKSSASSTTKKLIPQALHKHESPNSTTLQAYHPLLLSPASPTPAALRYANPAPSKNAVLST